MKILFIGGNFRNKGAEAMVLTSLLQFSNRFPSAELVVASYASKDAIPFGMHTTSINGTDCTFKFIKNKKDFKTAAIIGMCVAVWPRKLRELLVKNNEYLNELLTSDLVIDLSGFAMTDKRPLVRRIVYAAEILTSRIFNKPFIAFTQALGPFKKLSSRLLAKATLPLTSLICARGESTVSHLQGIGLSKINLIRCADSAYLFPVSKEVKEGTAVDIGEIQSGKPIIGIVTNSNIVERTKGVGAENCYIKLLSGAVDFIVEKLNAQPLFICHEIYEDREDDEWVAKQVINSCRHPNECKLIKGNHSAESLKVAISKLDFLISSRFHSLVAAHSVAVPSVAIAWAHKYHELFSEAGVEDSVFDAEGLELDQFLKMFQKSWENRQATHKILSENHNKLISSATHAFDVVETILRKVA